MLALVLVGACFWTEGNYSLPGFMRQNRYCTINVIVWFVLYVHRRIGQYIVTAVGYILFETGGKV